MKQENNYLCHEDPSAAILPGGTNVCVGRNDCRVQADVTVRRVHSVMIWGVVSDSAGVPVGNVLVRLMRYEHGCGEELLELCCTHTDCQGCYRFDLEQSGEGHYRVMVGLRGGVTPPPCLEKPPCPNPPSAPYSRCGEARGCRSTTQNCVQYY